MKYLLSFAVVLVLILAYFRLFPSAPINPVLPIEQGQQEVNGHNANVPKGAGAMAPAPVIDETQVGGDAVAPATPGQPAGAANVPASAQPKSQTSAAPVAQPNSNK